MKIESEIPQEARENLMSAKEAYRQSSRPSVPIRKEEDKSLRERVKESIQLAIHDKKFSCIVAYLNKEEEIQDIKTYLTERGYFVVSCP